MAKTLGRRTTRERAAEIAASKERLSEWPRAIRHLLRLEQLRDDISALADQRCAELTWYIPVALISCTESFFKDAIARLLDSGSPYIDRVADLKLQPLSIRDFRALSDHQVSLGEFVAYQQSYSSLESIARVVSTIADCDLLAELKSIEERMPWSTTPLHPGPVIGDDPGRVYESVKECFRLRHAVCHEGPPSREAVTCTRLELMHEAVQALISASFYFFSCRLLAHVPASHQERLAVRKKEADDAEQELQEVCVSLEQTLSPSRRTLLARAQEAWLAYSEQSSILAASTFEGGLMEREEYFHYLAYMRRSRASQLRALLTLA